MIYVLHSAVWSVAGFVFGYLLGHLGRARIGEAMAKHRVPRWLQQPERVVGIVILLLAVLTMATTVTFAHQLQRATECQQQFNQNYAEALARRLRASVAEQRAQRALIQTMVRTQQESADAERQQQQALRDYLAALDRAEANRKPLPSLDCPR